MTRSHAFSAIRRDGNVGKSVMGMTITAVPVAANAQPPAPQPTTERALSEFVANLQSSPMSGMPNLANPAALAGEVFGNLRGFVERAQMQRQSPRVQQSSGTDRPGFVQASFDGEPPVDPQSSPAPDSPEPNETSDGMSRGVRAGLDKIRRTGEMVLESMNFTVEVELVAQGASSVPRTVNTVLKGQ